MELPSRMEFYSCPEYSDAFECARIEGAGLDGIFGKLKGTFNCSEGELYTANGDLIESSHISVTKHEDKAYVSGIDKPNRK